MSKVYKVTWSVPAIKGSITGMDYRPDDKYKLFGSKEKADEFYEELLKAHLLIGLQKDIGFEVMEVSE